MPPQTGGRHSLGDTMQGPSVFVCSSFSSAHGEAHTHLPRVLVELINAGGESWWICRDAQRNHLRDEMFKLTYLILGGWVGVDGGGVWGCAHACVGGGCREKGTKSQNHRTNCIKWTGSQQEPSEMKKQSGMVRAQRSLGMSKDVIQWLIKIQTTTTDWKISSFQRDLLGFVSRVGQHALVRAHSACQAMAPQS